MSFYDKDHGPRDGSSLTDWVKIKFKISWIIFRNDKNLMKK